MSMLTQVQSSVGYVYRVLSSVFSGALCGRSIPAEETELMNQGNQDSPRFSDQSVELFEIIKLLSYNIFIRPPAPKFTHNVANDCKDQRLNSFIENYLDNYDVVCLQEMFGAFSGRRRKLIREAQKRGFFWKVSSPQSRSSMYLVDGGCLILSKVKIVAEASTVFPPGMMSDRLAAKGVIYAKLNPKPDVYVHLFVTHLQAIYPGSSTVDQCMQVQESQYDDLANFVISTVAEHESTDDMLRAAQPPVQESMLLTTARRWPVVIAGDFNCNSRPVPGDIVSKTTRPYSKLTQALGPIGQFSDLLMDAHGEHPVTYASAHFSLNGSFFPHETALTSPDDYNESAEFVNQSLDYVFLFPGSAPLTPLEAKVKHLEYVPTSHPAPKDLRFLSDHWAVETHMRSSLHIVSWNVASWPTTVANISKLHGSLAGWLDRHSIDILCLQEVKATRQKMVIPNGWKTFLAPCKTRPGLNGVATLVRNPLFPTLGADPEPFSNPELSGRCILTEHGAFTLINVYVPYDGENGVQLGLKVAFLEALLALIQRVQNSGRSVICVGDFNVAREPRDVHYEFRKLNLDELMRDSEPRSGEVAEILKAVKSEWPELKRVLTGPDRKVVEISNGKNGVKFALKIGNVQIGSRQSSKNACDCIANPGTVFSENWIYKEEGVLSVSDFFEVFSKISKFNFSLQAQMAFSDLFGRPRSPPIVLQLWDKIFEECNFIDTYIAVNPAGRSVASERFTCWDQYRNERYENKGARIDYCLVAQPLSKAVRLTAGHPLGNLSVSPERDFALRAATAESRWHPVPFSGGGLPNASTAAKEFEFIFSNPPQTGIIYTPPLFSDHVATSLVLDLGAMPVEGINERAGDELGTMWKTTMASAIVSAPHSLKTMFASKTPLIDITSSPESSKRSRTA